jgi:MoaA/NifB/PqqE/SkfB family radical SAM enzyme
MSLDKVKKVFKEIKRTYKGLWYLPQISMRGGEPFIKDDITDVLALLNQLGYKVEVITNGTLLSEEIIAALLRLSNISIMFSLDGPLMIHDGIRNRQGSFDAAIGNIKRLFVKGYPQNKVSLSYTVLSSNCKNISEFVGYIVNLGWKTKIEFQLLNFTTGSALEQFKREGKRYFNIDDLPCSFIETELNLVDAPALVNEIKRAMVIARRNRIALLFNPPAPLKDMERYYYAYEDFTLAKRCTNSKCDITIDPDGTVFPCFLNLPLGNVTNDNLRSIYYSRLAKEFRSVLKGHLFTVCRRCCRLRR